MFYIPTGCSTSQIYGGHTVSINNDPNRVIHSNKPNSRFLIAEEFQYDEPEFALSAQFQVCSDSDNGDYSSTGGNGNIINTNDNAAANYILPVSIALPVGSVAIVLGLWFLKSKSLLCFNNNSPTKVSSNTAGSSIPLSNR